MHFKGILNVDLNQSTTIRTAIIIQIEQLGNTGQSRPIRIIFSYWPTLIRAISVFRNLSRFYMHIEDKTETPCDVTNCRLIRQNVKKTSENKQYRGKDGCSCRRLLPINKGNNKITELRTILQRESPNS